MDVDTLGHGKYISLTTFRRDGTPVATPVWLVQDGDGLLVITQASSGKVKRIRGNPSVLVAGCDMRGNIKADPVPGTAVLLDVVGTARTQELVTRRYGLMGRLLTWQGDRRARRSGDAGRVGIRITLVGPSR